MSRTFLTLRGSESRESAMDPIELKRRWHVVELAARKRAIVMGVFAGILVLFAVVGYFGVGDVTLATQPLPPPPGIWDLFWRFMGIPLTIGGAAGTVYMAWFTRHHEGSVRSRSTTSPEPDVSDRERWRALRISNRIYLAAYVVVTGLGVVARVL